MTLTLNIVIQFFPKVYDDPSLSYVWLQKEQQFSRHNRNSHISIIKKLWALTVAFTLKIATLFSHMTLQLMMMHGSNKLCDKRLRGSEDITQTNNIGHFEPSLLPWLRPQQSNIFTGHFGLWWSSYHQTKSGCKRFNTSEEVERESKSGYAKEQASKTQQ